MTRANAEAETPWRQLRHDLRLLHHDQWMARIGRDNRGAELDALGAQCCGSEDGNTIQTCPARGHPGGMDAELLRLFDHRQDFVRFVPRTATPISLSGIVISP